MLDEQAISPRWSMKTVAGENIILHICISPGCHPAPGGVAALQLVTAPAPSCREAHPKPPPPAPWDAGRHLSDRGNVIAAQRRCQPCRGSPVTASPPAVPLGRAAPLGMAARGDGVCMAAKAPVPQLSPSVPSCPAAPMSPGWEAKWIFYLFILNYSGCFSSDPSLSCS